MCNGEVVQSRAGGNIQTKALKKRLRVGVDFFRVNQAKRIPRLTTEIDIRRDIQIAKNVQLLMDEGDSEFHRIGDVIDHYRPAFNEDFPGIRLIHAAEDFHEGGFARAVFPAQGNNLATPDGQIDVVEGFDAGESLGNSPHFEQRRVRHIICQGSFSLPPDNRRHCLF